MATDKKTKKDIEDQNTLNSIKEIIENVAENVIEGALYVSEKIKDGTVKAYETGSEIIEEANDRINQFTDKISLQNEQKKVKERQSAILSEFGKYSIEYFIKNNSIPKSFLTTKKVSNLVIEYKSNQKDLNSIEKKLKKLNS